MSNKARLKSRYAIKSLSIFIIVLLTIMSFSSSALSATLDANDGLTDDDDYISLPTVPDDDEYDKYGIPGDKNTLISIAEDISQGNKTEGDKTSEETTTEVAIDDANTTNQTTINVTTIESTTDTNEADTTYDTNTIEPTTDDTITNEDTITQDITIQTDEDLSNNSEIINSLINNTLISDQIDLEYKSEEELGNILSGEKVEVTIESEEIQNIQDTYIENLKFTPTEDLENVKVSITYLTEKPEEVEQPTIIEDNPIYGYVDIKLTSNDIYIDEMLTDINFKVKREWIENNNIDENSIVLIRYHDGEWQQLETHLISSDNTSVYYESITPGFSTFAVVGSSLVKIDDPYASKTMPEIPFEIMILLIVGIVTLLIFILFKSRYIYFRDEKIIEIQKK